MAFTEPARATGPGGAPPVRLFRLEKGESVQILTLTESYGGMFTHWSKGSSIYCPGDDCRAPQCATTRIWKGYAPVVVFDPKRRHWIPAVLEITEKLELDFSDVWRRGQVWRVWRPADHGKKPQPVMGELVREIAAEKLPRPFDISSVLWRIYRREDLELTARNSTPRPVYLDPVVLDDPVEATGQVEDKAPANGQGKGKLPLLGESFRMPR